MEVSEQKKKKETREINNEEFYEHFGGSSESRLTFSLRMQTRSENKYKWYLFTLLFF